jgi:signal transduction histidine kinase
VDLSRLGLFKKMFANRDCRANIFSMFRWIEKFERRSRTLLAVVALGIVAVIGFVDFITGFETSFSIFYLLAITLAAWFVSRGFAIFISILSVVVSLAGDLARGAHFSSPLVPAWNATILIAFYLVVVWLLTILRSLQRELEARVQQRTAALKEEISRRERLERELLEISERGQRQVGHDLHDSLGQHLTATAFASQVLTEQLENKSLPESASARHLVKMVEEAIMLTRTFARGLLPVEMEGEGLMDGFQELARKINERFKVSCEFECHELLLSNDAESSTHLYRIAQEAITNAIKHGKAKHISIGLEKKDGVITLTVTDDGIGLSENARNGQGMGLHIMAYRANMIGATFNINRLPESGTRVTCKLPSTGVATFETHGAKN